MADTVNEFPEAYAQALDEVLTTSSFAARYGETDAQFINAKTVNVPDIAFASDKLSDYDEFKTANDVSLTYTPYTLANDKQAVFHVDAAEDAETASIRSTQAAAQYERTIFVPAVDKDFFAIAAAKAKSKGATQLTAANIKDEIRKARSQFTQSGLMGGELYISSAALALLEDAVDRQFSNETSITDSIGSYDGFQLFETPDALLGADFTVISGGKTTIRYITKRAVSYMFAPGSHTQGDNWLSQHRWVFGTIVPKNKVAGIYTNKAVVA